MAFTVTSRGSGGTNSFVTSLSSIGDSFTPAQGDLIIFNCFPSSASAITGVTADASWSATFSQIRDANGVDIWAAFVTGSSPSAGQLACTCASSRLSIAVAQIAGADDSGTVGDAIVQAVSANGYDVKTSLALGTFSSFASSGNLCFTFGENGDETKTSNAQSGFTKIFDADVFAERLAMFHRTGEELNPTFDYDTTNFENTRGASFEIAEAAAPPVGGGSTSSLMMMGVGF